MESDLTRDIIKKERHHKTRTNVLLSTGKVDIILVNASVKLMIYLRRLIT